MTKRMFKYPLEVTHRQIVYMHSSAVPYWVTEQQDQLVLYAMVSWPDPGSPKPRIFQVVTTGDEFEGSNKGFIGATTLGGWFQAFVFEIYTDERVTDDVIDRRHTEDFDQIRREHRLA